MPKIFKVEFKDGTIMPVEVAEDETPIGWLKDQPQSMKADIIHVTVALTKHAWWIHQNRTD